MTTVFFFTTRTLFLLRRNIPNPDIVPLLYLLSDLLGDICCVGESVLLGLMAPLVRMRDPLFRRRI